MTSFCGYCGSELDSSDRFCSACGKPVTDRSDAAQATHSGAEGSSEESSPHRSRRRIGLVVLLAALGLAGGVAAVLMVTGERQADAPEAQPSSTTTSILGSTSSSGLSGAEVERLGSALSSGDPDQIASVIGVPEGVDVTEVAADMLPAGAMVTVHRDSFVDFGEGFGAVEASLSGSVDATVSLYLRFVDGVWLVSGTSEPVGVEE